MYMPFILMHTCFWRNKSNDYELSNFFLLTDSWPIYYRTRRMNSMVFQMRLSPHHMTIRVLNKTPLTFNWISRHLVHESPFWWEGHGSSFVVDASVVFQRIPSEYSLLHLFCPVYGRKIKHSNVFWQFKKIIEKITLMLKNLNESACLIAIYLIFLQKSKKKMNIL